MGDARGHKHRHNPTESPAVAAGKLQRTDEDQDERGILDEVGLGAHPPQQRLLPAIAHADLIFLAKGGDAPAEPEVEQHCCDGAYERDRNRCHANALPPLRRIGCSRLQQRLHTL